MYRSNKKETSMDQNSKLLMKTIDKNKKLFYKIAYTYMRNHDDAEDVLHNAYEKAYRMNNQIKNPSRIKSWLATIVKNEANQVIRRRTLSKEKLSQMQGHNAIDDQTDRLVSQLDLKSALALLSEQDRDLITLKYLLGYKQKEISKLLELPLGTVKSKTSRALDTLREILGGDFNE